SVDHLPQALLALDDGQDRAGQQVADAVVDAPAHDGRGADADVVDVGRRQHRLHLGLAHGVAGVGMAGERRVLGEPAQVVGPTTRWPRRTRRSVISRPKTPLAPVTRTLRRCVAVVSGAPIVLLAAPGPARTGALTIGIV